MKKILFLLLVFCFSVSILGCSDAENGDPMPGTAQITFTERTDPVDTGVVCEPDQQEPETETPIAADAGTETEQVTVTVAKKRYIRSKVSSLIVHSGPSLSSAKLGRMDAGDMVAYEGKEGSWYRTRYLNGDAYVYAGEGYTEIVEMELADERTERVIALGEGLIGTPYVYGAVRLLEGSSVRSDFDIGAFDCSSFMQYIFYYGADVILRETTRTQVRQGQEVNRTDLRRGDLIFMTNSSRKNLTGVERIGHVALYLGDGYILHTASDYAVIEKMTASRWNNYITARRML